MTENEEIRLTTDKKVTEMGMYELAHNCCYIKDGVARYRDFERDVDAREFARDLYKIYTDEELSKEDEIFDEEILEELQYDLELYPEGLIALFYRNLWAMAELRENLKEFEAIGTVDEFKALKEKMQDVENTIISRMQEFYNVYKSTSQSKVDLFGGKADAIETSQKIVKGVFKEILGIDWE